MLFDDYAIEAKRKVDRLEKVLEQIEEVLEKVVNAPDWKEPSARCLAQDLLVALRKGEHVSKTAKRILKGGP